MRIATFTKDQQHHVGVVGDDGQSIQLLDVPSEVAKQGSPWFA